MIKAALFDMDGVLIDSEKWHLEAWRDIFKEIGVEIADEEFAYYKGALDLTFLKDFIQKRGLELDIEEWRQKKLKVYLQYMREKIEMFPGAKEFIESLYGNYKIAITSSAWRVSVETAVKKFGLNVELFLGKEDVKEHKPDPEVYTKAAEMISMNKEYCCVFEDSLAGVKAAKSAGMKCVAVTNSYTREELIAIGADLVVDRLDCSEVKEFIKN